MKDRLLALLFISTIYSLILSADEPSAFGAGDINNPSPYGLTEEEKLLLQNKQKLKKVTVNTNKQYNELQSLKDRLDGLQGIIESISRKSHENKLEVKTLNKLNQDKEKSSSEFQKRLIEVSSANTDLANNNLKEIEKLKVIIVELSGLIDNINKNYVSKDEFNSLVSDVNSFKELVTKELKGSVNISSNKSSSFKSRSNAQIAKDARKNYDKKNYTLSIEMYTYLIDKNYRPARAHYMIGEMKYYRKKYSEAIAYFKKSAKLYSKAKYMPTLMLHTAFSMKYNDDIKNAKSFFRAIVKKYPKSKYSKEAEKQLKLIK